MIPDLTSHLAILGCGLALLLVHLFAHPRLRLMREVLNALLAGSALSWFLGLPVAATLAAATAVVVWSLPQLGRLLSGDGRRGHGGPGADSRL